MDFWNSELWSYSLEGLIMGVFQRASLLLIQFRFPKSLYAMGIEKEESKLGNNLRVLTET